MAGTNVTGDVSRGIKARRAWRRHVKSWEGVSPCRRATLHTDSPDVWLSATMAAFSSADQVRRRPAPVNNLKPPGRLRHRRKH